MNFPLRTLRPVGNPVSLDKNSLDAHSFGSFRANFYQSGTAALAAALVGVQRLSHATGAAEVILPAYTCPDLISACVNAGVKPVLADLEPDSCRMSIERIEQAITSRTIAIIAVRFLGIAERMEQLNKLCRAHGLLLIEDSAQGFPVSDPDDYWCGDIIVLSFGRGKPINLLCGGALLTKNEDFAQLCPSPGPRKTTSIEKARYLLKARLYNILIKPDIYGAAIRLPGLHIGDTSYKPLSAIEGIADFALKRLATNIDVYSNQTLLLSTYIRQMLENFNIPHIVNLPDICAHDFRQPLLRYPILLAKREIRDKIYKKLYRYGASTMYQRPLPALESIPSYLELSHARYEHAADFADRLITLPTHTATSQDTIKVCLHILQAITD